MTDIPLMLNLGCSDDIREGFVNVDFFVRQGIFWANLNHDWPWNDSSVDFILARDIIEHLLDKVHTMNEAWRVLKPGSCIHIEVPTTGGTGAFQDPTHVSYWNERSFLYYEKGNPYRERFAESYGIKAAFKIVKQELHNTQDGPKLNILLEAVK